MHLTLTGAGTVTAKKNAVTAKHIPICSNMRANFEYFERMYLEIKREANVKEIAREMMWNVGGSCWEGAWTERIAIPRAAVEQNAIIRFAQSRVW